MDLRERGASTLIGVVLLVALVVILGATVTVYATNLADELHDPALTEFEGSQSALAGDNETNANVIFSVESGEPVRTEDLHVFIDGQPITQTGATVKYPDPTVSPGDDIVITQNNSTALIGTEKINLVYSDSGSESEQLLGSWTVKTGGPSKQSANFTFESYPAGDDPGDPWNVTNDVGNLKVTDSDAAQGDKSLYMESSDGVSPESVSLTADLTHVETLQFKFNNSGAEADDLELYIDGTEVADGRRSGWVTITVDVSEYTGTHTLKFRTYEDTDDATARAYIDDIRFIHESGNLVPAELVVE